MIPEPVTDMVLDSLWRHRKSRTARLWISCCFKLSAPYVILYHELQKLPDLIIDNLCVLFAVENSKTFEELLVEDRIMKDRAELALPLNSLNQMWVYDAQTCIATRPKK